MKKFKRITIMILAVLPMIYTAVAVFFILPDTVSAHFGIDGTPDRYGSKYEAFLFPAIILGITLLYFLYRKFQEKSSKEDNDRTARNLDILDTVILIVMVLFNALCVFLLTVMKHPGMMKNKENMIFVIISCVIGVLFILLGNILPKTKPNSFIGIRLSWCMDSDEHWYIANRNCGIAMVLSGICTVIAGLIVRNGTYVIYMILSLIVFLTVATIYSYVIIKKK
ncbi:SdpI family protein [uncultured Ruminococcus sp.]|uniref:SdpI family protein n=1 Tax=uncultured Ruminococcus sp. TaxID=165186 RepID=UPI002930B05B|nr:SdpI family protein [uncultured Ruminococcus sp.]